MRKRVAAAVCAALLVGVCGAEAAQVENGAVSAILMEAESGRVLYEKNAHEQRHIASITKLLTALVAVESTPDLSQTVKVEREWLSGAEGSSIYLAVGEELTLEALLYGLLLESGNDAAQVVAAFCAGDVETFMEWMNLRAEDLGMADSHFVNPSGLTAEGHYSTAYDMALCAVACMENETVAKIVGTKSATFGTRTFTNHNKLLGTYDGCVGMKTGYTELAGRTLVTCVERDGMRLIAVTLSDRQDWEDHKALYDYGFSAYTWERLCEKDKTVRTLPVTGSLVRFVGVAPMTELYYPLAEGEEASVFLELPDQVAAPIQAGGIAGRMEFYLGQTRLGGVYLTYTGTVDRNIFFQRTLMERIREMMQGESAGVMGVFLPMTLAWQSA